MPIDVSRALGAELPSRRFEWTESDVLLYHLATGVGGRPDDWNDPRMLAYTYEGAGLKVLPSFAVVAPGLRDTRPPSLELPGCEVELESVLHAGQEVYVREPLPVEGSAVLRSSIAEVWDTGKAAVVVREGTAFDSADSPLWTVRDVIYVKGEGGWGGDRPPRPALPVPGRAPDMDADFVVAPQQAMLYRLCGDRNPLHVDPGFARAAGLPRPILHGLCTYAVALREIVDWLLDGRVEAVGSFAARFVGVVYPGETLRLRAWREPEGIVAEASVGDRRVLADCVLGLSDGVVSLSSPLG